LFLLFRRRRRTVATATIPIRASPPTTPPTMAPMLDFFLGLGVMGTGDVDVGPGVDVVVSGVDVVVIGVDDGVVVLASGVWFV
jgi:hypothetical protein